jgi:hypothetical protein
MAETLSPGLGTKKISKAIQKLMNINYEMKEK